MEDMEKIPFIVLESTVSRMERIIKRLTIALIVTIFLIFTSNIAWLYAWMQYDYSSSASTETVTIDGKEGVANYIGNDGDITNGSNSSEKGSNEADESKGVGE